MTFIGVDNFCFKRSRTVEDTAAVSDFPKCLAAMAHVRNNSPQQRVQADR